MKKLLCFCDTPTVHTGYGCVSRNLIKRWAPNFDEVAIWGINYSGWPHKTPYKIYPAGHADWWHAEKIHQFIDLLMAGDYTHLFIMHDLHFFTGDLAKALRQICDQKKVKLIYYFPVDGPVFEEWLDLVKTADSAVTYTQWGKSAVGLDRVHVLGHGVDTEQFHPLEERGAIRQRLFKGWAKEDDFVMVNVNRNERRKAPHHSLQILAGMIARGCKAKLYMHMPRVCVDDGTDLEAVGAQIGLTYGEHWRHGDEMFRNAHGKASEEGLNHLYNAADLVLSTSLGEGWGLSLTEGIAAGAMVAAPRHTSITEIADTLVGLGGDPRQFRKLPLSNECVVNMHDMSRVRVPVSVISAVDILSQIANEHAAGQIPPRFVMNDSVRDWLSWDRIADRFLRLMEVK